MTDRRQFLKQAGATGAALAMVSAMPRGAPGSPLAAAARDVERFEGGAPKELMMEALNAATSAGATWADARIARFRQNFVITREHQIVNCADTDTLGCGIRALVDGCWGFAATRYLTTESVTGAAREAVAIAKADRIARDRPVELALAPAHPNATAPMLKGWYDKQGRPVRSHGCAYADSWSSVSFQRMPNVSLLAGKEEKSR